MKSKVVYDIFFRYFLIILVAIPNLFIFYYIFTPLTVYPVYFLLSLFFETSLVGNIINIPGYSIEIIKACVAGSAYYLLLILNLSTPKIKLNERILIIFFTFSILLALNILRIFILSLLLDSTYFDITHQLFWYLVSSIFVIGIWFTSVKYFNIKKIPIYSDLKLLFNQSIFRK